MSGSAVLRLFVAAYPPREAVERLLGALSGLRVPSFVPVRPEQLHLTLLFMGETRAGRLPEVCESVDRAAAGISGFRLTARRVVTLPKGDQPRVLAVETDAPAALMELQRRLSRRLANPSRSSGPFLPHVTLARFRHGDTAPEVDIDVENLAPPVRVGLAAFDVQEIRLVRSVQLPSGARHDVMSVAALEGKWAATDEPKRG